MDSFSPVDSKLHHLDLKKYSTIRGLKSRWLETNGALSQSLTRSWVSVMLCRYRAASKCANICIAIDLKWINYDQLYNMLWKLFNLVCMKLFGFLLGLHLSDWVVHRNSQSQQPNVLYRGQSLKAVTQYACMFTVVCMF